MWNNEWIKGFDYPEWGDTEVYKKTQRWLDDWIDQSLQKNSSTTFGKDGCV